MAADWAARCEQILADAERDLVAAVGGSSLCAIGRSGERHDGVKYLEGRTAALREFRRQLGDTSGAEAHREMEQRWQDHLRLALDRNMGPDWIAYRTGGVDALTDLAQHEMADHPAAGPSPRRPSAT